MSFKAAAEIERDEHDWGTFAAVSSPADGAERIMTVEAVFLPGKCHDFHRHPNQEEVIYVLSGQLEQWVEEERCLLGPGDAVTLLGVEGDSSLDAQQIARVAGTISYNILCCISARVRRVYV